ncbi:M15 family metallopeptidase [Phycicoccus sp. CMS6Z-2]|nr:M15 family metallopeptidase [Phycicoccus flavus]
MALVAVPVLAVGGRLVPAIEDAVDARQATAPETARAAREAGVTYDDSDEGGLDPALEHALDHARAAAAAEGIEIVVTSGWRSAAHQQQLFDEAVVRYGSVEEAHKWVLPPDESEHVTGRAVDVGPQAARDWLEAHGARWGLCRVYRNEPWHFERLAPEDGGTCPPMRDNA